MKLNPNNPCPCGGGSKYKKCCRPYHQGAAPPTAEALMRSRYSAYAGGQLEYILLTTDPTGPHFQENRESWRQEVALFTSTTRFVGLEILSFEPGDTVAYVTFRAHMEQARGPDVMVERSRFTRVGGRWLYHSGLEPSNGGAGGWWGGLTPGT